MKNTLLKPIQILIQKNRSKREHNLIGKWRGKKTKILVESGTNFEVKDVVQFSDKLEVCPEFSFSWTKAKTGIILFKNNYSNLVFNTQQLLGLNNSENWRIKKLTFNKLILVQQLPDKDECIEHHFEKSFEGYHEG